MSFGSWFPTKLLRMLICFWADEFQSLLLMGVFVGEDDSTEDIL